MDDEETQPNSLCRAHEPRLCSGKDFFQNPGPSSHGAEQEEQRRKLLWTKLCVQCVQRGHGWCRYVLFLMEVAQGNYFLDCVWIYYLFQHVLSQLVSVLQNIVMKRVGCSCEASLTQWDPHWCAGSMHPKKRLKELASCAHNALRATILNGSVGGVKLGVWSVIWYASALKRDWQEDIV